MYAQTCTHLGVSFAVGMLGIFQSNLGWDHWVTTKKVMWYLQATKDYMFTYRHTKNLDVIGYSNSNYVECLDSMKSTSGYVFMFIGEAVSWKSSK